MQITYYKEWSRYLDRDMEFKVFGSGGRPCLILPRLSGRFYDWENFGMIEKAAWWIDRGELQLFCVDSIDAESWADRNGDPRKRAEMQEKWFNYLTQELYPRILELNGTAESGGVMTAGVCMGAMQAVNLFLRRPQLFDGVIALSGRYDTKAYFGDYTDDLVYRNSPLRYLQDMPAGDPRVAEYSHADPLLLCAGQGAWEDEYAASTQKLADVFESKGISADLELWGYDVTHDWDWWQKQWQMFLGRMLG